MSRMRGEDLVVGLAQADHQPRLGRNVGKARLEVAQQRERVRVVRAGPRLPVQPRHRLEVVVHHVRRRRRQDVERAIEPAAEIGHQHLDLRCGRVLAHRADAVDEVLRAAVAQVVAVDAGDDDVAQSLSAAIVRARLTRLVGVERQRPAVADVAERAAARADVAHDHERRRALAEALADVRARRLLAHRVQLVLAQDLLDLGEARRRRRAHADPVGLLQPLGGDHLDRDAGGLRVALVLDAGGVGRRGRAAGGTGGTVGGGLVIAIS